MKPTQPSRLTPSPEALQKFLVQSAKQAQCMADALGLVTPNQANSDHCWQPARYAGDWDHGPYDSLN